MGAMKDWHIQANATPNYPPFGMTSMQFAEAQEQFTSWARGRIALGEQYDRGTHQAIEVKTPIVLMREFREELADAVNYLTALDIWAERRLGDLRELE